MTRVKVNAELPVPPDADFEKDRLIAMYCTQCGTQNLSDSKFCRECGTKIPPPMEAEPLRLSVFQEISQRAEAQDEPADPKLQQLLDMAFWHKNAGNARGAILACKAALILNPDCTTALSLLGCLYEETGRTEDALVMFERIVALNPTSAADLEKLEMLRKGVKVKAVEQPALYRWTPPALAQAVRERRITPGMGAGIAVLAVLALGVIAFHALTGTHPARASAAQVTAAPLVGTIPRMVATSPVPATPTIPTNTPSAVSSQAGVDPFGQAALIARIAKSRPPAATAGLHARHQAHLAAAQGFVPLPTVNDEQVATVPSVIDVRPLRAIVPSSVPTHFVPIGANPEHTVIVGEAPSSDARSVPMDDPNQPAPPQSQIEISVQDHSTDSDNATTGGHQTITLREDPGAALQQKALSYQQQSDYGRASAAYQTAIGAYKQDLAAGRNTDEARRGIAACETGLQICKQSQ